MNFQQAKNAVIDLYTDKVLIFISLNTGDDEEDYNESYSLLQEMMSEETDFSKIASNADEILKIVRKINATKFTEFNNDLAKIKEAFQKANQSSVPSSQSTSTISSSPTSFVELSFEDAVSEILKEIERVLKFFSPESYEYEDINKFKKDVIAQNNFYMANIYANDVCIYLPKKLRQQYSKKIEEIRNAHSAYQAKNKSSEKISSSSTSISSKKAEQGVMTYEKAINDIIRVIDETYNQFKNHSEIVRGPILANRTIIDTTYRAEEDFERVCTLANGINLFLPEEAENFLSEIEHIKTAYAASKNASKTSIKMSSRSMSFSTSNIQKPQQETLTYIDAVKKILEILDDVLKNLEDDPEAEGDLDNINIKKRIISTQYNSEANKDFNKVYELVKKVHDEDIPFLEQEDFLEKINKIKTAYEAHQKNPKTVEIAGIGKAQVPNNLISSSSLDLNSGKTELNKQITDLQKLAEEIYFAYGFKGPAYYENNKVENINQKIQNPLRSLDFDSVFMDVKNIIEAIDEDPVIKLDTSEYRKKLNEISKQYGSDKRVNEQPEPKHVPEHSGSEMIFNFSPLTSFSLSSAKRQQNSTKVIPVKPVFSSLTSLSSSQKSLSVINNEDDVIEHLKILANEISIENAWKINANKKVKELYEKIEDNVLDFNVIFTDIQSMITIIDEDANLSINTSEYRKRLNELSEQYGSNKRVNEQPAPKFNPKHSAPEIDFNFSPTTPWVNKEPIKVSSPTNVDQQSTSSSSRSTLSTFSAQEEGMTLVEAVTQLKPAREPSITSEVSEPKVVNTSLNSLTQAAAPVVSDTSENPFKLIFDMAREHGVEIGEDTPGVNPEMTQVSLTQSTMSTSSLSSSALPQRVQEPKEEVDLNANGIAHRINEPQVTLGFAHGNVDDQNRSRNNLNERHNLRNSEQEIQQESRCVSASFLLQASGVIAAAGGIAAVIVAFTILNFLSLGTFGIAAFAVGSAFTLAGIGMFAYGTRNKNTEQVSSNYSYSQEQAVIL